MTVTDAVRRSFAASTAYDAAKWTPDVPSTGHCAIVALVIQDILGGDIVFNRDFHHYWNLLPDGSDLDLTRDQFPADAFIPVQGIADRHALLYSERAVAAGTLTRYAIFSGKVKEALR